jgi:hypothetical protein
VGTRLLRSIHQNSLLYHDKIVACYNELGADNLRIIETNNLSSNDVHKQLFEYLEIRAFKISIIIYKNATLLGDSKAYLELILPLTSIKLGSLKAAQYIELESQTTRVFCC